MSQKTRSLILATTGPEMHIFTTEIEAATLKRNGSVTLPSNVHFGWPSPDNRLLYVASSNGDGQEAGDGHYLSVLAVDAATGSLRRHGTPVPLRSRPVHLCLDREGRHVLVAYHYPAGLSVHRIARDGSVAEEIPQDPELDFGIYPHQIMPAPSGRQMLLVTRGNNPTAKKPEEPGALKLFDFSDGRLTLRSSAAPHGGYGFGPRNCDFHRALPYVYVTLERQTKLHVFRYEHEELSTAPIFVRETMERPEGMQQTQNAGDLRLHPEGHTLYVANRGGPRDPRELHVGGENSITVFRLDAKTGEPTAIQHADSHGARPRTFGVDPTGRLLWAANMQERLYEEEGERRVLPACIATFRIRPDGTLDFAHRHDVDTSAAPIWWSGMLTYEM